MNVARRMSTAKGRTSEKCGHVFKDPCIRALEGIFFFLKFQLQQYVKVKCRYLTVSDGQNLCIKMEDYQML